MSGRRPASRARSRAEPADELGGEQVEGRQAVRELFRAARRPPRELWVSRQADPSDVLDEIVELARRGGVAVRRVGAATLAERARTEAPQGVIAWAAPVPAAGLDDLLEAPDAFLVALDGVTDPQNLGAIIRTAETAGATGLLLPRHRSAGITPTVAKAAAGAVEHLPIAPVAGIPATLDRAHRAGCWTVGLDAGGRASLFELEIAAEPLVLVLGAEGQGLGRLTRRRCDLVVHIPTAGRIASLNVSAAAALACFEVARRRAG
ncbi:MAG: 23S rRNA (guanosine(2251)-2'-O)-methyltransferase RlmB [Acidimicrobiia bacterium]